MIDCYTFATPNGQRVLLMLELTGLPYRLHTVDITQGMQHEPEYRAIHPAGFIPVIIDSEGPDGFPITVTQSAAILLYLAQKIGCFLPGDERARWSILEWLMHATSDINMTASILWRADVVDETETRIAGLMRERFLRLLGAIDQQLEDKPFLVGELSIADIALFPFLITENARTFLDSRPHLNISGWISRMSEIPAIARCI